MENYQVYLDQGVGMIIAYGPKLLLAILTLIIGLWVIKSLSKASSKMMKKSDMDESLRPFLTSIITVVLKVLLVSGRVKTMHFSASRFQLLKILSLSDGKSKKQWSYRVKFNSSFGMVNKI